MLSFIPLGVAVSLFLSPPARAASGSDESKQEPAGSAASRKYELVVLRGRVIELGPHLMKKYEMPTDDDLGKNVMVLLTDSGEVHPLVKDLRSRGFWMDKQLRDRPMELHVHRFAGLPFLRLIDAYSIKDGKKFRVHYWCEICAIMTFEPGPCPCCQDDIPLREVPVDQ